MTDTQLSLQMTEASQPAETHQTSQTLPPPTGWPEPPTAAAYHGVFGAIIEKLAPNTEADPIAILTQLLVACGSAIGAGPHFQVEATPHHSNEFLLLVGDTAKARKGSALDHVTRLMRAATPASNAAWSPACHPARASCGQSAILKMATPAPATNVC